MKCRVWLLLLVRLVAHVGRWLYRRFDRFCWSLYGEAAYPAGIEHWHTQFYQDRK